VFVGALTSQAIDGLRTLLLKPIAQLPSVCAQPISEPALLGHKCRPRLVMVDRKLFKDLARTSFGHPPRLLYGVFEILAKFTIQRRHWVLLSSQEQDRP
jgi:hypothetical protein